jgi:hypothetical protein
MKRETEEQYEQQRQILTDWYNGLLDKLKDQVGEARDAALLALEQQHNKEQQAEGWVDDVVDVVAPVDAPAAKPADVHGMDQFGDFFKTVNDSISETLRRESLRNWLAAKGD